MALNIGETLGPYEILGQIGKGGMGEVYRAKDTRLGRDVAIKVSTERFSERFEREAKVIASLNHQNICSLFDVGPNFLVMELVEGTTLAFRIAEGPIPVEEALPLALQIAEALQSAHDKGIVHRDLKPANIKITPEGTVKVLDFGLAKLSDATAAVPSDSPTISMATQAGMILGTAAYMSPEQARGRSVDKRSDIWAFGAVLYEMIAGRQLFRGEDISETLASVIMKEPDLESIPPKVRQVLRRCLEKDPKKRLRDISGVALLLEQEPAAPPSASAPMHKSWLWPAVAAVAVAAAVVLGLGWYRARTATPALKPLVRLNVDLGPDVTFSSSSISGSNVILSADGQRLAYISRARLYTLRLDQTMPTELAGTEGAYGAFFSPDGRWLAFYAGAKLKKVSVDGGAVVALSDSAVSKGGSWGEDGTIIASLANVGGLSRISDSGGTPTPVTKLEKGEATHRWPQILPGGKAVVYTANSATTGYDSATIKVLSLIDGKTKTIQQGGAYGRVVKRNGHAYLLYINRSTLFAVPFDLDRLELSGSPTPVLENVGASPAGAAEMDISMEGTVVFRAQGETSLMILQWMNADGKLEPLLTKPGIYGRPSLSPQGDRVAVEVSGSAGTDIWIYDSKRDNMSRLTFATANSSNVAPIWSPDGRYIVYQDIEGMSWIRSDGGAPQSLTKGKSLQFPWAFTPDGKRLSYLENAKNGYDLWTVPLEGDVASGIRAGKPEVFLNSDFDERSPSFSPDGRWMAYSSNEGGTFEVYVRAFPDKGAKWQVSNGGGNYPRWSLSGHELFYETNDAHIMTVPYSINGDSFVPGKPMAWSPKPIVNLVNSVRNFDLAPDGKRIAALMPVEGQKDAGARNVTFLFNFFDELERRVPERK